MSISSQQTRICWQHISYYLGHEVFIFLLIAIYNSDLDAGKRNRMVHLMSSAKAMSKGIFIRNASSLVPCTSIEFNFSFLFPFFTKPSLFLSRLNRERINNKVTERQINQLYIRGSWQSQSWIFSKTFPFL